MSSSISRNVSTSGMKGLELSRVNQATLVQAFFSPMHSASHASVFPSFRSLECSISRKQDEQNKTASTFSVHCGSNEVWSHCRDMMRTKEKWKLISNFTAVPEWSLLRSIPLYGGESEPNEVSSIWTYCCADEYGTILIRMYDSRIVLTSCTVWFCLVLHGTNGPRWPCFDKSNACRSRRSYRQRN